MMTFLVRHGRALSKHEDAQRPLHAAGRTQVLASAEFLHRYGHPISTVLCSSRLRTRQSAEIIAQHLNIASASIIPSDHLDPGACAETTLDYLSNLPVVAGLLVVGHLPNLAELASLMLAGHTELRLGFATGAIYCLATDPIAASRAELQFALAPDQIRQLTG